MDFLKLVRDAKSTARNLHLAKKFDLTRERGHFLCSLEAYLRKTNLHRLNKAKKTSDGKDCSPVIKLHGVHTKSHRELSGCYSKTDADPAHHVGGRKPPISGQDDV